MAKMYLSLVFASVLISQTVLADVPSLATTFETNVTIDNATTEMAEKIRTAEELIRRVITTDEFRNRVIGFTYGGKNAFVDNGGYTNEEIYLKLLEGAETLNKVKDNKMDLQIEMYYQSTSTVGYTYANSPKIYANTKFYNSYDPATITGNMTHEWIHKLGFTHASYYSLSRDASVPYAIGFIMKDIAKTIDLNQPTQDFFTAANNLFLSNTASNVTLKWSAATSSNGIESYKVYRRLSGSSTNYVQATTSSLTFTQTKPASDATYYIKVVDLAGKTLNSTEVNYVVLRAPSSVTATKTSTLAKISWTASASSTGIKEYRIYRKLSGTTTNYLQGSTTTNTFSQNLPTKSAYYYVKAVDLNGETKNSTTVYLVR